MNEGKAGGRVCWMVAAKDIGSPLPISCRGGSCHQCDSTDESIMTGREAPGPPGDSDREIAKASVIRFIGAHRMVGSFLWTCSSLERWILSFSAMQGKQQANVIHGCEEKDEARITF